MSDRLLQNQCPALREESTTCDSEHEVNFSAKQLGTKMSAWLA